MIFFLRAHSFRRMWYGAILRMPSVTLVSGLVCVGSLRWLL
jgi:hypothetical protein